MKSKYKKKALNDLSAIGFNLSFLIENYPNALMRIRLLSDMGAFETKLRDPEENEHPLQVAAQHVIRRACKLPIIREYFGIPFHPTPKAYRYLITQETQALRHLPHDYVNDELADFAVCTSPRNLSFLAPEMITKQRCQLAMEKFVYSIDCIPKEYITREMAKAAIENDGFMVRHIPACILDEELILKAIENSKFALEHIPKELLFRGAYEKMVTHHNHGLKKIPKEAVDYPLCLLAMQQSGDSLYSVPKKFHTPELLEAAIRSSPASIQYIDDSLRTEQVCLLALSLNRDIADLFVPSHAQRLLTILDQRTLSPTLTDEEGSPSP
jgi:hypothetical protein